MCVSVESWPNTQGRFVVPQETTYLQLGAQVLPVTSRLASAYCPGGCGEHRIAPKGTLRGVIVYEAFGDADVVVAAAQKDLHLTVTPYYCH